MYLFKSSFLTKLFIIVPLLIISSCSKNKNNTVVQETENNVLELSPLTVLTTSVSGVNTIPSSSLDFANVDYNNVFKQELIIKNNLIQTLSIQSSDLNFSDMAPFQILSNSCNNVSLIRGKACSIVVTLSNPTQLASDVSFEKSFQIKGSTISLSGVQKKYSAPNNSASFVVSPLSLNFGTMKSGDYKDVAVVIANNSNVSKSFSSIVSPNPKITILNSCSVLAPRSKCSFKARYSATSDEILSAAPFILLEGNQLDYSVTVSSPSAMIPEVLSIAPVNNSISLSLTEPQNYSGSIVFKNNSLQSLTDAVVAQSSHAGVAIQSVSCSSSFTSRKSCTVQFTLNSSLLPAGASAQTIKLVSSVYSSQNFSINANVTKNSVACSVQDALDNGVIVSNSSSAITGMKNGTDVSSCILASNSCNQYYSLATDSKSCLAQTLSCTSSDAALNGWTIASASSFLGSRVGSDVSACAIDTCATFYRKNSIDKRCDNYKKHVFLIIGQSNAVGQGTPVTCLTTDAPNARIEQWSRGFTGAPGGTCPTYTPSVTNDWILAQEPLQHQTIGSLTHGFALKFAKNYLATLSPTETVGLVLAAKSGSSFAVNWNDGLPNYLDAVQVTNAAMAKPETELKGIIWQQGESDSTITGSHLYKSRLEALISNFKRDIPSYNSSVVFLTSEMVPGMLSNPTYMDFAPTVNLALKDLRKYVPMTYTISSSGTTSADNVHFDKNSLYTLADRYFAAFSLASPTLYTDTITDITRAPPINIYTNTVAGVELSDLTTVNGTLPLVYSFVSQDSSALSITGNILKLQNTGVPAGSYNYVLRVTDANNQIFDKNLSLNVGSVTPKAIEGAGTSNARVAYTMSGTNVVDMNSNFSVSMNFKPHLTASAGYALMSTESPSPAFKGLSVTANRDTRQITVALRHDFATSNAISYSTFSGFPLNKWMNVIFTWNASTKVIKIYFNGQLKATAPTGTLSGVWDLNSTTNFALMNQAARNTGSLNGKLSEVTIWNTLFSDADALSLYNNKGNPAGHSLFANMVHYLQAGASATSFTDSKSGSSVTGTGTSVTISNDGI